MLVGSVVVGRFYSSLEDAHAWNGKVEGDPQMYDLVVEDARSLTEWVASVVRTHNSGSSSAVTPSDLPPCHYLALVGGGVCEVVARVLDHSQGPRVLVGLRVLGPST